MQLGQNFAMGVAFALWTAMPARPGLGPAVFGTSALGSHHMALTYALPQHLCLKGFFVSANSTLCNKIVIHNPRPDRFCTLECPDFVTKINHVESIDDTVTPNAKVSQKNGSKLPSSWSTL